MNIKKSYKTAKIKYLNIKLYIIKKINKFLRNLTYKTHKIEFQTQWGGVLPNPEWFNHYLDVYYYWPESRNSQFLERGCFSLLAIKNKANILELCCGDGFNTKHFYSLRADKIIAVDFDVNAINHAKKNNYTNNIEFRLCDIRYQLPQEKFDNILWDAAIEHFTEEEIFDLMQNIKVRLTDNGILSGHTIVKRSDGKKSLEQHEYEFASKEDLLRFLQPYFKNIRVFETIYPTRHNLYFYASDAVIPFDANWQFQAITQNFCKESV